MAGRLRPTRHPIALRIRAFMHGEKNVESLAAALECTSNEASRYLSGSLPLTWERLRKFAEAFHASPTWIMFGQGEKDIRKIPRDPNDPAQDLNARTERARSLNNGMAAGDILADIIHERPGDYSLPKEVEPKTEGKTKTPRSGPLLSRRTKKR